ncbi:helix-turn-helix domain-containing protein [Paenibacillus sp. GYB004]|uniref:helix-turn-helix domain-containing protein n=1 Tax=Paenibacillus sp. GYB004 TaxID=2994393 RepID=UPI002F968312
MNLWRKYFRVNRLFVQILLYFLSLLLPIALIGTFTYDRFVDQFKREFTEKITMNMRSSALAIDNDLRMVQESIVGLFGDTSVIRLMKPFAAYSLEERTEVHQLLNGLRRIRSIANTTTDEIFVYVDNDKVYTSGGVEDFGSFFTGFYRFAEYDRSFWERKRTDAPQVEILDRSMVQTPFYEREVVPLLTSGVIQGNKAVIVASVSLDAIRKTLSGNVAYPNTRFIVTSGDGRFILASDQAFPNSETAGEIDRIAGKPASLSEPITIEGKKYLAAIVQSDIYGWKYYALTPAAEFNKQAGGIVNMLLLICAVLGVISIAFSFVFTFRIYNPIRRISDILNQGENGTEPAPGRVTPSDEFERIGQGIDQLLRYNRQFEEKLRNVSTEYLDVALLQLLQGGKLSREQQSLLLDQMGYSKSGFACCTILFEFKTTFYSGVQDVDRMLIHSKLKKLIWGTLQDYADLYVLECRQHQYICVVNLDDEEEFAGIRSGLEQLAETFRYDAIYCSIHIETGRLYPGLDGIPRSYREAMDQLRRKTSSPDFVILREDKPDRRVDASYLFSDENKLLNLLKLGDEGGLSEAVDHLLRSCELKGGSAEQLHSLISDMAYTGLRFVSEKGIGVAAVLTEREEEQLFRFQASAADPEERRQLLHRLYSGIAETMVRQQHAYRSGALLSAIMSYIDEHYNEDLYLDKIADKMNVSVKYVSRVFKEKTGMNITDYISQVRISKAKELLVHSDLPIGAIAEKVGIHNRTTFLRTFKKVEGLSPNDFRKSIAADANREAAGIPD